MGLQVGVDAPIAERADALMDKTDELHPTSIRITDDLRDAVRRRGEAEGRTLSQQIVFVLRQYVQSTPEPKPFKLPKRRSA